MASTIKAYIELTIDDITVRGFPLQVSQSVDEIQQFVPYEEPVDGNDTTFSALPVDQIGTVQFLLLRATDQAVGIRLEGGESGNTAVRLISGGLILIMNCTITGTNVTINNNAAAAATMNGIGAGT